jgi:uncharacterized protein YidB (DUF937 family)
MDNGKLLLLLDDPEARTIVYGLAHVYPAEPTASGPQRLRGVLQRLLDTADPAQLESWFSDQSVNAPITVEQVRSAFGDEVIRDLASYVGGEPDEIAWQLSTVLPDLANAFSTGGALADVAGIRAAFLGAIEAGDRSAGAFGFHVG